MSLKKTDWKNWCRTCGSNNSLDFNHFFNWDTLNDEFLECIRKLFGTIMIIIPERDSVICDDCHRFLKEMVKFSKRCLKIQNMFKEIITDYESFGECNILSVRSRYGLLEDDINKKMSFNKDKINYASNCNRSDDMLETEIKVEYIHEDLKDPESKNLSRQQKTNSYDLKKYKVNKIQLSKSTRKTLVKNTIKSLEDMNAKDNLLLVNDMMTTTNNVQNDTTILTKTDAANVSKENLTIGKDNKVKCVLTGLNKKIKCQICRSDFGKQSQYEKHMKNTHTKVDDRFFDCMKCSKRCRTLRGLKSHEIVHLERGSSKKSNKDAFVCEQCGKWCISNAALSEHLAVHSEDYPYECKMCLKKFKHLYPLRAHMKTHSGVVFVCDTCGLRFKSKRRISAHMVVHSEIKKFKCNYCGNEYKRATALKAHLIYHSGLKPYKCPFCDKSFTYGTSCRLHKKTAHPQELAELEASGEILPFANLPKLQNLQPQY